MGRRLSGVLLAAVTVTATLASCSPESPAAFTCSPAHMPDEGTTEQKITSAGTERSYLLHIPPGYDGSTRLPVIFLFHGVGDHAESLLRATGMDQLADEEGAIVVAPEGSGTVPAWHYRPESGEPASDVTFAHELLDRVKDTTCVDDRRVYATGFSNGSTLVLALACEDDRDFVAFGAVSGPYYAPHCDDAPPRSIIYFHGAADYVIPFSGAETLLGELPGVTEALTAWAEHDECGPVRTSKASADVTLFRWNGCARGSALTAYVLADGDHSWPPGWDGVAQAGEIRATDLIWEFFSKHALP